MNPTSDLELKQMYEAYSPPRVQNAIVRGRVVSVSDRDVLVSIGYKAEGQIPLSEWGPDEELPKVGDEIEVFVESLESRDGGG